MSEDTNVSKPTGDAPSPRRREPQAMMKLINSVLVAVGTLYLATESVAVTIIGASVAVALVLLYLVLHQS